MPDLPVVVLPEAPADEWDLATEWGELMGVPKPGGPAMFAHSQHTDTLMLRVPGNKVRSCVRQVLGYSQADNAAFKLKRPETPINHPRFRWMWATACSVEFQNPLGNPDIESENSTPENPLYLAKIESDGFELYSPPFTGRYGSAFVTVQFDTRPWVTWKDTDPSWVAVNDPVAGVDRFNEWQRLTVNDGLVPRLDLRTAENAESQFVFAEKNADGSTSPTPGTTSFPGTLHVRVQQTGYHVTWCQVEEQYTCGAYPADPINTLLMPYPRRLLRYLGAVNKTEFLGHPKNTLLYSGLTGRRYPQPLRTSADFGLLAWDWQFAFDQFDPKRPAAVQDKAGAAIADGTRKRGWQLFPYRPSKQFWFAASTGAAADRGTYNAAAAFAYEELEFRDLFRHVSDPAYPIPS